MEVRLRAFYAEHNPGNEQNIAEIVRKFCGRERQLCAKLFKKYGVAPYLTAPAEDDSGQVQVTASNGQGKSTTKSPCEYQRDFKPYTLPLASESPLDFRSSKFDALQALQTPQKQLKLPVATYPLDNIQKCRHLLPESDVNRQDLVVRPKKASPSAADAKTKVVDKKTRAATPTLFEQLADTYLDGPFRVLRRCFLERMRVLVVVRRVNSVRGTCSGFLKAFDKHMNLVLMDVSQEYIPSSTYERLRREVHEGKRTFRESPSEAVVGSGHRVVIQYLECSC
ncbi:hypothetical protein BBJ29_002394 [Phytophthora kernoviae]|uniref:Uncharacterized protein n=1 Tax=Phytophthora kernoviae TaxID=325452 RepID=A0A3F2RTL9_9STRA|nr:hypothetical protein BBP00_00003717 [Phytophthora kernoviae]RLN71759.1 hypothetical protein BBJ29_002394 [Phytophthora kernoviae]